MPLSTRFRNLVEVVIRSMIRDGAQWEEIAPNSQVAASCEDTVDTTMHADGFSSAAVPGGCPAGVLARCVSIATKANAFNPPRRHAL